MHKLRSSPIGCADFSIPGGISQMGYRYRVVPYRLWRFCAPSERPRRSKTRLVVQEFCRLLISYHSCIFLSSMIADGFVPSKPTGALERYFPLPKRCLLQELWCWLSRNQGCGDHLEARNQRHSAWHFCSGQKWWCSSAKMLVYDGLTSKNMWFDQEIVVSPATMVILEWLRKLKRGYTAV